MNACIVQKQTNEQTRLGRRGHKNSGVEINEKNLARLDWAL